MSAEKPAGATPAAQEPASLREEYLDNLRRKLTLNSKPLINMFTTVAAEKVSQAPIIVDAIETHIAQVASPKLQQYALYLLDSICKNVGGRYIECAARNLRKTFVTVFESAAGDENVRKGLIKLLATWHSVFPVDLVHSMELFVQSRGYTPMPPAALITSSAARAGAAGAHQPPPAAAAPVVPPTAIPSTVSSSIPPPTMAPPAAVAPPPAAAAAPPPHPAGWGAPTAPPPSVDPRYWDPAYPPPPAGYAGWDRPSYPPPAHYGPPPPAHYGYPPPPSDPYRHGWPPTSHWAPPPPAAAAAAAAAPAAAPLLPPVPPVGTAPLPPSAAPPTSSAAHPLLHSLLSTSATASPPPIVANENVLPPTGKPVVKLTNDAIRRTYAGAVESLYSALPRQCKNCGLRFSDSAESEARLNAHLDWHFRQNVRDAERAKRVQTRGWFVPVDIWYVYRASDSVDAVPTRNEAQSTNDEAPPVDSPMEHIVPVRSDVDDDDICGTCGEKLVPHLMREDDQWVYKNAVRVDEKVYHVDCAPADAAVLDGSRKRKSPTDGFDINGAQGKTIAA